MYKEKLIKNCPTNKDSINKNKKCKPKSNWDSDGYLYDSDIRNLLKKYEGRKLSFELIGIERESLWKEEHIVFNFPDDIKKTSTYYALVLLINNNHWISIFIDMSLRSKYIKIEYFDSMAKDLTNDIRYIIRTLCLLLGIKYNKKIELKYNTVKVQKDDGECGIWVIDFILSRISEKYSSIDSFILDKIKKNKSYIINKRKELFS